jgi:hypothetical protein
MPKFFIFAEGRLPGGLKPPIRITHFEFNAESQGLNFEAAIDIEMQLMSKLLLAGYKIVNGVYPGTDEEVLRQQIIADDLEKEANKKMADMASNMERLKEQTEAVKKETMKESTKDKLEKLEDSPPQSPKGTPAPRDIDTVDTNNTPVRPFVTDDTPPRRRVSEPEPYTGTLGAGLDISPLRTGSGSRAITIKDPKTKMYRTPTKSGRRTSFAVDDTIQEENENED